MQPDKVTILLIALTTMFLILFVYLVILIIAKLVFKTRDDFLAHFGLRKNLITGILVWLPIIICIWLITTIVEYSDHLIKLLPPAWRPENILGFQIPGYGIVVCVILLFVTGLFANNVLGKKIVNFWDKVIGHIPIIKTVYGSVKKVSESLLSDSRQSFKTPILVQFPHQGAWTMAFVSGAIPEALASDDFNPDEYVAVYVPTTPNPTSGYYIMVKKSDTRAVNLTVDDALKYIISVGMVMPDGDEAGNVIEASAVEKIEAKANEGVEAKDVDDAGEGKA